MDAPLIPLSEKEVILQKLQLLQEIGSRNIYFGTLGTEPPEDAFFQPVARFNFVLSGTRPVVLPIQGQVVKAIMEVGDVQISLPNSWEKPMFEHEHEVLCLVPRKTHFRVATHLYEFRGGSLKLGGTQYHTGGPASEALRDVCLAISASATLSRQEPIHHLLAALKEFAWEECAQTQEETGRGRAEVLFKQIRGWVETHFQDPISREIVADQFNITPSHLSRLYRKMTGYSFSTNLLQERMDFALTLLSKTNLAIYQIATQCGFSNTAYFVKCFREMCGESPGRFRRKLRM